MKYKILLALIMATALTGCFQSEYNESSKYIEKLSGEALDVKAFESQLEQKMALHKIPGMSLAVINNGKLVYSVKKGFADKSIQAPVTQATIFEGASLSKPVFGFLVMTFVDEGVLDLDKPLYQYLPNPDLEYDSRYKTITARMVLSQRAFYEATNSLIQYR